MLRRSLSALGNVVNALVTGNAAHINYRDSKLTRVLQVLTRYIIYKFVELKPERSPLKAWMCVGIVAYLPFQETLIMCLVAPHSSAGLPQDAQYSAR